VTAQIPNFAADVTVRFRATPTGIVYAVTGHHDHFPSFELYVNDWPALRHEAEVNAESFALLMNTDKIDVPNTGGEPVEEPLHVARPAGG